MTPARLTKITAEQPPCITKQFQLAGDGTLRKRTTAHVTAGRMEAISVASLAEFASLLQQLEPNQALAYGVPAASPVELVSEADWAQAGRPEGKLPRTRKTYSWAAGPGVMMLDYDADDDPMARDDLIAAVRGACPDLADTAMLWWPSTSSCLYNGEAELRGVRGQRLYLLVQEAADIPRAGKALETALWAAGHGHFAVSASGALLPRTLVDTSVWQPERIDFAAGALCELPIRQQRGAPVLIPGTDEFVDSAIAIPDPDAGTTLAANTARAAARAAKTDDAQRVRSAWIEERAEAIVARLNPTAGDADRVRLGARYTARHAVERSELLGDWVLTVVAGAVQQDVTVAQVLDSPAQYHGALTLEPIEPEYDGGRPVGKLFLYGARPSLHSFAHGGTTYRLLRQPGRTEIARGREHDVVLSVLDRLRMAPDVFDFGTEIVIVDGGHTHPLNADALRHHLGGLTQFWRWHQTPQGTLVEVLENPPLSVAKTIVSMQGRRKLKPLSAIVTAPTLRPDGDVLDAPGHDAATGLLLELDGHPVQVPRRPTLEQADAALTRLWRPFENFPFVGPQDRGNMLAALLTAAVRPALPTAPAFGFDAPTQGSGKTLLALCVGVLATGAVPAVMPHVETRNGGDDEIRKRLFAVLRAGDRAVLWDNIIGTLDSASLAAALTAEFYRDRILGESKAENGVPNRAMFILTGNNLSLAGDMPRRVLQCRVDPKSETPFAREFDLDPKAYCLAHRQELIAAALTLVRAWLTSGDAKAPGKTASFEVWDDFVRQTVVWSVRRLGFDGADPLESMQVVAADDPEQEALRELLDAWLTAFGDRKVTAREVLAACTGYAGESSLGIAMGAFVHGTLSAKSIGRVLMFRKDRIVDGKCLRQVGKPKDISLWTIEEGFGGFGGFDLGLTRGVAASPHVRPEPNPPKPPNPPRVSSKALSESRLQQSTDTEVL